MIRGGASGALYGAVVLEVGASACAAGKVGCTRDEDEGDADTGWIIGGELPALLGGTHSCRRHSFSVVSPVE